MLRPDGELRFYEHVIPSCQPKRLLLQAMDHIEEIERFGFSAAPFQPLIPHILGTARRT